MSDNLTKVQRSYTMSRIRSKWTKQELAVHNFLKGNRIMHRMHPQLEGSPDVILLHKKVAVFLNGCFWHKCPKCYKEPKSRKDYWLPKIAMNVKRDKRNEKLLKSEGFMVIKIWEHQFNKSNKIFNKLSELR